MNRLAAFYVRWRYLVLLVTLLLVLVVQPIARQWIVAQWHGDFAAIRKERA